MGIFPLPPSSVHDFPLLIYLSSPPWLGPDHGFLLRYVYGCGCLDYSGDIYSGAFQVIISFLFVELCSDLFSYFGSFFAGFEKGSQSAFSQFHLSVIGGRTWLSLFALISYLIIS